MLHGRGETDPLPPASGAAPCVSEPFPFPLYTTSFCAASFISLLTLKLHLPFLLSWTHFSEYLYVCEGSVGCPRFLPCVPGVGDTAPGDVSVGRDGDKRLPGTEPQPDRRQELLWEALVPDSPTSVLAAAVMDGGHKRDRFVGKGNALH